MYIPQKDKFIFLRNNPFPKEKKKFSLKILRQLWHSAFITSNGMSYTEYTIATYED